MFPHTSVTGLWRQYKPILKNWVIYGKAKKCFMVINRISYIICNFYYYFIAGCDKNNWMGCNQLDHILFLILINNMAILMFWGP